MGTCPDRNEKESRYMYNENVNDVNDLVVWFTAILTHGLLLFTGSRFTEGGYKALKTKKPGGTGYRVQVKYEEKGVLHCCGFTVLVHV